MRNAALVDLSSDTPNQLHSPGSCVESPLPRCCSVLDFVRFKTPFFRIPLPFFVSFRSPFLRPPISVSTRLDNRSGPVSVCPKLFSRLKITSEITFSLSYEFSYKAIFVNLSVHTICLNTTCSTCPCLPEFKTRLSDRPTWVPRTRKSSRPLFCTIRFQLTMTTTGGQLIFILIL